MGNSDTMTEEQRNYAELYKGKMKLFAGKIIEIYHDSHRKVD